MADGITPVDQTSFGKGHGNCFAACVASLTGIPLDELTIALGKGDGEGEPEHWLYRAVRVMKGYGFQLLYDTTEPFNGFNITCGPAERGLQHSVITVGGILVHDPHPSRAGLLEQHYFIALRELAAARASKDGGADGSNPQT